MWAGGMLRGRVEFRDSAGRDRSLSFLVLVRLDR